MEPLTFTPLYMTRVWGGRTLESSFGRTLPDDQPYGESWEISDREQKQSIVNHGPWKGKTLHELWTNHREELFGDNLSGERFPLLIKILDAQDDLSIQVHPPKEVAQTLGGDPKTEMWYIANCTPEAKLYVGLKEGVTQSDFEQSLEEGSVAEKVHAITPKRGESIFIESGRLHAIGAGFLIYEIQQNSDTTYRVFDWNRLGLDGKSRELHLKESMASIDFTDFEPTMDTPTGPTLAKCPYFVVDEHQLESGATLGNPSNSFSIICVVEGEVTSEQGRSFHRGDFLLLPRMAAPLRTHEGAKILQSYLPR